MYTYTEKALSKAEISVIPGKNPDESNWYIAYTFKQASNLKNIINVIYIAVYSFQVNSESILILIGWQVKYTNYCWFFKEQSKTGGNSWTH